MNRDGRSPDERYDVIVIGGGIHGIMLTLQTSARGLRPLLLEVGDFGQAATWNSLRILHGGMSALQAGNWQQAKSAIRERAWLANQFPDLTEPLPCLWPIYGQSRQESVALRWTHLADNALTHLWTRQVATDRRLPGSRMLSANSTRQFCSAVPGSLHNRPLRGSALWYELTLANPPRLIMELLRWAAVHGAQTLNYFPVRRLVTDQRRVQGVVAIDRLSGTEYTVRAPVVFDCTGGELAANKDFVARPRHHDSWLIAFNLLLHRRVEFQSALAQRSITAAHPHLMLIPRYGRLVAGTRYCPLDASATDRSPRVSEFQVASLLSDLNATGFVDKLSLYDVAQIQSGLVPASRSGSLTPARSSRVHHESATDGLAGLVTITGCSLTSAREVAEAALRSLWPRRDVVPVPVPPRTYAPVDLRTWQAPTPDQHSTWITALHQLIGAEQVHCWEDLLRRRTDWAQQVDDWRGLSREIAELSQQMGRPLELPLQCG